MGTSADAILFYGYLWTDEEDDIAIACKIFGVDEEEHDAGEWIGVLHERRGGTDPFISAPDRPEYETWREQNAAAISEYFAAKKAIAEEFGVDLGVHGYLPRIEPRPSAWFSPRLNGHSVLGASTPT